jgi:hypothetical protein
MSCSFSLFVPQNDLMMKIRVIPDDNNHYLFSFFFVVVLLQLNKWFSDDWITELERKGDKLIEYRSQ